MAGDAFEDPIIGAAYRKYHHRAVGFGMLGVLGLVIAWLAAPAGLYGVAIGLGVLAGTGVGAWFRSRQIGRLIALNGWHVGDHQ